MKRITVAMLKRMGACSDEVDTFKREWPRGCAPNKKNILRAQELGLSVDWFIDRALTGSALAEYKKATAPALAEFRKAKAPAWAEYNKAEASAWAAILSDPKNWKGA